MLSPYPNPEQSQSGARSQTVELDYFGEPGQIGLNVLAEDLNQPQAFDKVLNNFENGKTRFGDVSGYWRHDREEVLRVRNQRTDKLALTASSNLLAYLQRTDIIREDQTWRFLVESARIVTNHPTETSAQEFSELFNTINQIGAPLQGIDGTVHTLAQQDVAMRQNMARLLFIQLASNQESGIKIGRFLAVRSVDLEQAQRQTFSGLLSRAKVDVSAAFTELADESKLNPTHAALALRKIQCTDHAAADHLTIKDSELALYISGALRVAIRLVFSPADSRVLAFDQGQYADVARHELFHAAAAEFMRADSYQRDGLGIVLGRARVGGQVSEAMAQFQSQYTAGFPHILRAGSTAEQYHGFYPHQFNAMMGLWKQNKAAFNILFNANYGQSSPDLHSALQAYYENLDQIYRDQQLHEPSKSIRSFIES